VNNDVFVKYVALQGFSIKGTPDRRHFGITVYDDYSEVTFLNWETFNQMKEELNPTNIGDFIYDHPEMFEKFWGAIEETGRVFWADWPDGEYQEVPIDVEQVVDRWRKKREQEWKNETARRVAPTSR